VVRLTKTQWVEAFLLAPASFLLCSALPFGIAITTIALVSGLATAFIGGWKHFPHALSSSRQVAVLWLMMVAAALGLGSLWLTLLMGPEWVLAQPRRRSAIVFALLAGLAAAAYWFARLRLHDALTSRVIMVWTGLLFLPLVVAVRYLWVLLRVPGVGSLR
jgi:hypothetical protein